MCVCVCVWPNGLIRSPLPKTHTHTPTRWMIRRDNYFHWLTFCVRLPSVRRQNCCWLPLQPHTPPKLIGKLFYKLNKWNILWLEHLLLTISCSIIINNPLPVNAFASHHIVCHICVWCFLHHHQMDTCHRKPSDNQSGNQGNQPI